MFVMDAYVYVLYANRSSHRKWCPMSQPMTTLKLAMCSGLRYASAKELNASPKEPYISAKEPHTSAK